MRGKIIFTTTLLGLTQTAMALVNLKDASLQKTWIDYDDGKKSSLYIERTYSSRSLSRGIFGFGWCSNLDSRLEILSTVEIALERCTDRVIFHRTATSNSNKRRPQWQNPYRPEDVLIKDENGYLFVQENGNALRFSQEGQLTEWSNPRGTSKIRYRTDGRIDKITDGLRGVHFHYPKNDPQIEVLEAVVLPDKRRMRYEIREQDLLRVDLQGKLHTSFLYDEQHNLTKITNASNQTEVYQYDGTNDRLISSTRKDGCHEIYNYRTSENRLTVTSVAHEICGKKKRELAQIEFIFAQTSHGDFYLARTRTQSLGKKFEIQFDPFSGRPLKSGRIGNLKDGLEN